LAAREAETVVELEIRLLQWLQDEKSDLDLMEALLMEGDRNWCWERAIKLHDGPKLADRQHQKGGEAPGQILTLDLDSFQGAGQLMAA